MRRIVNFFKALFGKCETESLPSENWTVEEDGKITIKLGEMPELCELGKGVYLKGQGLKRPILVVRTDADTYLAYTNRCTHALHRKLDPITGPDPGQPILRCCSMGHSTFDYEGNRLSGPAKEQEPLDRHEIEMSDGNLVITLKVPAVEEAAAEEEPAEEAAPEPGAPEETAAEAEKAEEPVGEASAAEETVGEPETTEEAET